MSNAWFVMSEKKSRRQTKIGHPVKLLRAATGASRDHREKGDLAAKASVPYGVHKGPPPRIFPPRRWAYGFRGEIFSHLRGGKVLTVILEGLTC